MHEACARELSLATLPAGQSVSSFFLFFSPPRILITKLNDVSIFDDEKTGGIELPVTHSSTRLGFQDSQGLTVHRGQVTAIRAEGSVCLSIVRANMRHDLQGRLDTFDADGLQENFHSPALHALGMPCTVESSASVRTRARAQARLL